MDSLIKNNTQNGVVLVSTLFDTNPHLASFIRDNTSSLSKTYGVDIVDDTDTIKGGNLFDYIRYYYGDDVDLTDLREEHNAIYQYICVFGDVVEVLESKGFNCRYRTKSTTPEIIEELNSIAAGGVITGLPKSLDNKVRYRATKEGMTVREYLERLGFHLAYTRKGY